MSNTIVVDLESEYHMIHMISHMRSNRIYNTREVFWWAQNIYVLRTQM